MKLLPFEEAVEQINEYIAFVEETGAGLTVESLAEYDSNLSALAMKYVDASITLREYATTGIGKNAYEVFHAMTLLDRKTEAELTIGRKRIELQAGAN